MDRSLLAKVLSARSPGMLWPELLSKAATVWPHSSSCGRTPKLHDYSHLTEILVVLLRGRTSLATTQGILCSHHPLQGDGRRARASLHAQ